MNFLLLILRVVLGHVFPAWRDSLFMAARLDGRVEHHLQRPGLWERWVTMRSHESARRGRSTLAVRAVSTCLPRGEEGTA